MDEGPAQALVQVQEGSLGGDLPGEQGEEECGQAEQERAPGGASGGRWLRGGTLGLRVGAGRHGPQLVRNGCAPGSRRPGGVHRGRQGVSHAGDLHEAGASDHLGEVLRVRRGKTGSAGCRDHQGGHLVAGEPAGAVHAGDVGPAVGGVGAVMPGVLDDPALEGTGVRGVEGKDVTAQQPPVLDPAVEFGLQLQVGWHGPGPQLQHSWVDPGQLLDGHRHPVRPHVRRGAERLGAQQGRGAQPVRVVGEQELGEHPAQGEADDMGPVGTAGVEDRHGVGRELGDRVRVLVERPGGAAGVAVVVADDAVVGGEEVDERIGPADPTGLGAHDQQKRRCIGGTALLHPEADAGGGVDVAVHGGLLRGGWRARLGAAEKQV